MAASLPFDSSSALLLTIGAVRDAISLLNVTGTQCPECEVQSCCCMYLLETESRLLYFSVPAPPTDLSAEVAEFLLSLSPSIKSWGWHTVRLVIKFTMLRAIVWDFQMTQTMIVSSANLRLQFKDTPAIMKLFLACLCVSPTQALSSPCTISAYQETLEKQICIPLEAMLWCWEVWKM